jgi:hypothetical protein
MTSVDQTRFRRPPASKPRPFIAPTRWSGPLWIVVIYALEQHGTVTDET